MFHSGNEFPVQDLRHSLGLSRFESTQDAHGNHFTLFTTIERKRSNQILDTLKEFNRACPAKAVQIDGGLGTDPAIVTFSKDNKFSENHIYLQIKAAREASQSGGNVPYKIWTTAIQTQQDRDAENERNWADYTVQHAIMNEDPSAFNLGESVNKDTEMACEHNSNSDQDEEISEGDDSVDSQTVDETQEQSILSSTQLQISDIDHVNGRGVSSSPMIIPVDREFSESQVLKLDRSITTAQEQTHSCIMTTGSEIILNQESMEQNVLNRIGDLEDILITRSSTLETLTKKLHEAETKLQEVIHSRDQEESKRAIATQAHNKAMKEKDHILQQLVRKHQLEIQTLKQSANFSLILKSIDQKLGTGMAELQAAMQFYEDSDSASDPDIMDTEVSAELVHISILIGYFCKKSSYTIRLDWFRLGMVQ